MESDILAGGLNVRVYSITSFDPPILWVWSNRSIMFENFTKGSDLKTKLEDLLNKYTNQS